MKEETFLRNLLAPIRFIVRKITYPVYLWGMDSTHEDLVDRVYSNEKYRREHTPNYQEFDSTKAIIR